MIVWSTRWSEIHLNEKYSSTQHFCLCSDTKSLKSTVIVTPLHWVSWALNQGPRILFNYYKEISAVFMVVQTGRLLICYSGAQQSPQWPTPNEAEDRVPASSGSLCCF